MLACKKVNVLNEYECIAIEVVPQEISNESVFTVLARSCQWKHLIRSQKVFIEEDGEKTSLLIILHRDVILQTYM